MTSDFISFFTGLFAYFGCFFVGLILGVRAGVWAVINEDKKTAERRRGGST